MLQFSGLSASLLMAKTVLILKSKLDGTEITIHQSALYPEASAAPSYSSRCLTHYPRGLVCTEVSVFPIYFDSLISWYHIFFGDFDEFPLFEICSLSQLEEARIVPYAWTFPKRLETTGHGGDWTLVTTSGLCGPVFVGQENGSKWLNSSIAETRHSHTKNICNIWMRCSTNNRPITEWHLLAGVE